MRLTHALPMKPMISKEINDFFMWSFPKWLSVCARFYFDQQRVECFHCASVLVQMEMEEWTFFHPPKILAHLNFPFGVL